jgi:hypothetical protein
VNNVILRSSKEAKTGSFFSSSAKKEREKKGYNGGQTTTVLKIRVTTDDRLQLY